MHNQHILMSLADTTFRDMRTCSLVDNYQCSKASHCLRLHGRRALLNMEAAVSPKYWTLSTTSQKTIIFMVANTKTSNLTDHLSYHPQHQNVSNLRHSRMSKKQKSVTTVSHTNRKIYFPRILCVLPSKGHQKYPNLYSLSQQLKFPCIGPIDKSLSRARSPPDAIETHVTLLSILFDITNKRQATTSTDGSAREATFQSKYLCHGVSICWQQSHSP
jgi:hypothetical protein